MLWVFSGDSHKKAKHKFYCQSSLMSAKNSKKLSKKLPEFSSPNPDCPVGYHSFDTVKGYQNHLTHFPLCTEYNSRLLSLQSLGKQPSTQLTATVPLPREEVIDLKHPASRTLHSGNARVTQQERLNPECPTGMIPDHEEFQTFGDIEDEHNNEAIPHADTNPLADANTNQRPSPPCIPQVHALEDKAIWKLLVILDSTECPSRLCF